MDNDFEIIGIDHGWSMVKTSSQVFVTGVKEITTEPGMFDDVLELDGKYYKIGGVRLEVRDVKIENDNFYILTLAGIARELRKRGKKEANGEFRIDIEFGKEHEEGGKEQQEINDSINKSFRA